MFVTSSCGQNRLILEPHVMLFPLMQCSMGLRLRLLYLLGFSACRLNLQVSVKYNIVFLVQENKVFL